MGENVRYYTLFIFACQWGIDKNLQSQDRKLPKKLRKPKRNILKKLHACYQNDLLAIFHKYDYKQN